MKEEGSALTIVLVITLVGIFILGLTLIYKVTNINNSQNKKIVQASPTPYMVPTPRPSIDPVKNIPDKTPQELGVDLSQKRLYFDGMSLNLSSLDGKTKQSVYQASGNDKVGLVGDFVDKNHAYYGLIQGQNIEKVYKKDFLTGQINEIFEFTLDDKNLETFNTNAQISPDESQIAYSGKDGVYVYNLGTKNTKILLKNSLNCEVGKPISNCYGYISPRWSADQQYILLDKLLYEGSTMTVFNLLTNKSQDLNLSAGEGVWAKDGHRLVLFGSFYGTAPMYFVDAQSPLKNSNITDLVPKLEGTKSSNDTQFLAADWSSDGRLVFIYQYAFKNPDGSIGIGLIDSDNNFKTIVPLASTDFSNIFSLKWLENNQGLLLNTGDSSYVIGTQVVGKYKLPIRF